MKILLLKLPIHLLDSYLEAVVQRCSVKRVFSEISQNPQENTCARVSFLIKLQASRPQVRLSRRCFPVNFEKFLRTPFFIEHLWWLLLSYCKVDNMFTVLKTNTSNHNFTNFSYVFTSYLKQIVLTRFILYNIKTIFILTVCNI